VAGGDIYAVASQSNSYSASGKDMNVLYVHLLCNEIHFQVSIIYVSIISYTFDNYFYIIFSFLSFGFVDVFLPDV
jgi:hypothetical protein